MDTVAESHGDWFLPTERRIPADQIARDDREYGLADTILVGCETAARTIRDHAADPAVAGKVRVLPYCFDEALFSAQPAPQPVPPGEPVRFLFVGQANPRKGIHLVLEAIARFPRGAAELTIVGDLRIPRSIFAGYADQVTLIPTVARSEIPAIMAAHHVLLFPSYFEGSALSLLEGLASGLALIQSAAAGNGVTPASGILLDRLDTDTLETAIHSAIADRDRLNGWRSAAQGEAQAYSFAHYRENIGSLLDELSL
jgi:glycosyltransferase involved in cell wall biosynthesis